MKLSISLSSAILAVGMASSAMATDTIVYISGATAFRNATNQAILKYLGAGVNNGTGVTPDCIPVPAVGAFSTTRVGPSSATVGRFGYVGSNWSTARAMTVIANDFPAIGDRTIFKTSWSGSEAGIKAVADPATSSIRYLPASFDAPGDVTLTAAGLSGIADPTVTGNPNETHLGADVCMTDSWQETSNFFGGSYPVLTEAVNSGGQPVGIVPFFFVKQKGAPAGITNMSANGARSLYLTTGYTDAQMLSGDPLDAGIRMYGIGRDLDSGTRFINLAETGIGTKTVVKNWRPNVLQGGTALSDYPAAVGAATYTTVAGSNTITCSVNTNTINLCLGMTVASAGIIPANSIIGSFPAANTFTIIKSTDSTSNPALTSNAGIGLTILKNVALAQGTTNGLATARAWYKVPIQVVNGVSSVVAGNGGENSGGVVATFMKLTSTNAQGYAIAYISPSDAPSVIQGAPGTVATALTYEGVGIVTATNPTIVYDFNPIRTGAYKYWSYEHMYYNAATIPAAKKSVIDGVCEQIYSVDAALSNQLAIDASLKVKRAGTHVDGSNIIMNSYTLP